MKRTAVIVILILPLILVSCADHGRRMLIRDITGVAEQGEPEVQYHLGMMYNNGLGVEQSPETAFEWFLKAAAGGEPLASYKLGCYYGGQFDVVPLDVDKALEHKLVAAEAGYDLAQLDVGNLYFENRQFEEGLGWWKKSAAQGQPGALYNLSTAYFKGESVEKDKALAYAYFKLAKLASETKVNKLAQKTIDELAEEMTPMELNRANNIVGTWRPVQTDLTLRARNGIAELPKYFLSEGRPGVR